VRIHKDPWFDVESILIYPGDEIALRIELEGMVVETPAVGHEKRYGETCCADTALADSSATNATQLRMI
jgi:hypothetical protein